MQTRLFTAAEISAIIQRSPISSYITIGSEKPAAQVGERLAIVDGPATRSPVALSWTTKTPPRMVSLLPLVAAITYRGPTSTTGSEGLTPWKSMASKSCSGADSVATGGGLSRS